MKMYSDASITKEDVDAKIQLLKSEMADLVISNQTFILSQSTNSKKKANIALALSILALIASGVSLYLQLM